MFLTSSAGPDTLRDVMPAYRVYTHLKDPPEGWVPQLICSLEVPSAADQLFRLGLRDVLVRFALATARGLRNNKNPNVVPVEVTASSNPEVPVGTKFLSVSAASRALGFIFDKVGTQFSKQKTDTVTVNGVTLQKVKK